MKKLLIVAICFTAIFSMSSCTDDSSADTQNESSISPSDVTAGGDGVTPPIKK